MINKVMLLGRVGKIETKTIGSSGVSVTNLSIVTSKKIVKDGDKIDKPTWHNVTLFSKLSEIAEKYVKVGDLFYVEGEIESNNYIDQNGISKYRSYVNGHEIKLMPKTISPQKENVQDNIGNQLDDEVPF